MSGPRATQVTKVATETDEGALIVTVTVVRPGGFMLTEAPLAADVPADVRAALRTWLAVGRGPDDPA